MAKKQIKLFLCESCGNEFPTWAGKCSACGEWNSLKEISVSQTAKRSVSSDVEIKKLSEIEGNNFGRIDTGIGELNRVLGGGIVPGTVILVGGEPGIGKSTLLLQLSNNIKNTYYLSAEESAEQIKIRADRLKISESTVRVLSTPDLQAVGAEIGKSKPDLLIIDSIQTVFLSEYPSSPGSLVQVRECGIYLQQLAKTTGIPIIIVGHVTKDGSLAGPRILEHLVDVVLYLEGERFHDARVIRGVKNRFGATNEVGIFSLQDKGMVEIKNPSELFLMERQSGPGSVVTAVMEGTRPILVEVQALVNPSNFGFAKRTTSGFDLNRLNLLAAVITKKTPVNLSNSDIYINIVGGMKISEPSVDLAVCAAIMSSYKNRPIDEKLCIFGEVGLSGEVRKVTKQTDREKEAKALGYKIIQTPKNISEVLNILSST